MKLSIKQINELDKKQLTPQELQFLKLRVVFSVTDIARFNGLSREYVNRILKRATTKVKEQVKNEAV